MQLRFVSNSEQGLSGLTQFLRASQAVEVINTALDHRRTSLLRQGDAKLLQDD